MARGLLLLWAAAMVVMGGFLLARHVVALPRPAVTDPQLVAAVRAAAPAGQWALLHVLSSECGCSRRVRHHLLRRGPIPGVHEEVVLVGDNGEEAGPLRARGFATEVVRPQQLWLRYHVEAAPLLVIRDAAGLVRYAGGYTERKQGPVIHDVDLLAELRAGRDPRPLPALGCAVSESLRRAVDPLRLSTSRIDP